MPQVSVRKLAILAVLAAADSRGRAAQPIFGITRLQKLLFLISNEIGRISLDRDLDVDFAYQPEKYGPADLQLYSDLEFLEALGHITKRPNADDILAEGNGESLAFAEDVEEAALSFDYLMGDEHEAAEFAIAENVGEQFSITKQGLAALQSILGGMNGRGRSAAEKVLLAAQKVRQQFGEWPLPRLLRYVYSTFPEMTTASRIRERVMRPY